MTAIESSIEAGSLLARRPHFRREGSSLFFFLSSRPFHTLTMTEAELWDRLQQGMVRVEDVPDLQVVRSLAQVQLIEVIAPVEGSNRRQILVIEPHSDDAALSIGGTMWKMRNEAEFHLLTMASRSNYTSAFHLHRDYFDRAQITAMRTSEGELFVRHLGGHYYCADLSEATLRYDDSDWNLDFFGAHEVSVAISNNRRADEEVLANWISRLEQFIEERTFDEIWIPLGAGTHGDHDLARNAALRVVLKARPKAIVRLYEDVPYGSQFPEHTQRILDTLTQAGGKLTPWPQDVTEQFAKKLSLLRIFASQFRVPAIQPGVERSAADEAADSKVERLWTLDTPPSRVPADALWIAAADVRNAARGLPAFEKGAATAKRLAVFAISAAGRWSRDVEVLKALFPRARLVVYAAKAVWAELDAVRDPRVEVILVEGGATGWLSAALREVATSHRLVIAGDAVAKAKGLSLLWPLGRTIIVSDIDHFMQAVADRERVKIGQAAA